MKNLLSIIMVLALLKGQFLKAQAYIPFPDSNAMWTDRIYDPSCGITPLCSINQYRISGDTVINAISYKTLTKSGYLVSQNNQYTFYSEYAGGFRQEITNKRVFYFPPYGYIQKDTLLYDFNLNVGDSLPQTYLYPGNLCDAIVDIIDSVAIGTSYHKRFHISTVGSPPWGQTWLIEGIGCTHGLLGGFCFGWEGSQDLTCFTQGDTINYPGYSSDCDIITSVSYLRNNPEAIVLSPNPANNMLSITFPINFHYAEIEIYDNFGLKFYCYSGEIINGNFLVPVLSWAEGIYILKVKTFTETMIFKKFIVIHK